MTENEAIEFLKGKYPSWGCDEDEYENAQTAIQALEEIQAYRAIGTTPTRILELVGGLNIELSKYAEIGTIEEFKALKEKNEPKKADYDNYDEIYICPNCEKSVGEHQKYCWNCGQAFET